MAVYSNIFFFKKNIWNNRHHTPFGSQSSRLRVTTLRLLAGSFRVSVIFFAVAQKLTLHSLAARAIRAFLYVLPPSILQSFTLNSPSSEVYRPLLYVSGVPGQYQKRLVFPPFQNQKEFEKDIKNKKSNHPLRG